MVAQPAKREINMFSASRRPFLSVEQLFNTQGMTTTTQTLSSGSGTAKDSPVKNLSLQWSIWSILNVRMRTNIHFTWMGQLLQPLPPLTPKLDLETLQSILDFSRLVFKPELYPWINDDFVEILSIWNINKFESFLINFFRTNLLSPLIPLTLLLLFRTMSVFNLNWKTEWEMTSSSPPTSVGPLRDLMDPEKDSTSLSTGNYKLINI